MVDPADMFRFYNKGKINSSKLAVDNSKEDILEHAPISPRKYVTMFHYIDDDC